MMDVDEPATVSIFGLLHSFHASPTTHSTILTTVDTSQLPVSKRQLHELTFDELTQQATSTAVLSGGVDDSGSSSRKVPRKPGKDGVCVQLQNTGRFVFAASMEQVSDIYRVMGRDVNAVKSSSQANAADTDTLPLRKMNELTLSASEAESATLKTAPTSSSQKIKPGTGQNVRSVVGLKSSSQQQQQQHLKTGSAPTPAAAKPTMNAGRAAAKARMAAMGEEWPEEEDLPGFSRPNPASSVNASTGTLSRDASKQLNDAMQRQKKVVIAKRKG